MGLPAISRNEGNFVALLPDQESIRFPQAATWGVRFHNDFFGRYSLESQPGEEIATGLLQEAKIHRGEKTGLFWLAGGGIFTDSKTFRNLQECRKELRFLKQREFSLQANTPLFVSVLCYRATGAILYFGASMDLTRRTVVTTRSHAETSDRTVKAVQDYLTTLEADLLAGLRSVR